jgi:hypothetical protein
MLQLIRDLGLRVRFRRSSDHESNVAEPCGQRDEAMTHLDRAGELLAEGGARLYLPDATLPEKSRRVPRLLRGAQLGGR